VSVQLVEMAEAGHAWIRGVFGCGVLVSAPLVFAVQSAPHQGAVSELPATGVVYQLYKDFGWTALFAPGKEADSLLGAGLLAQPRATLERYFDPALTDMILAEDACVKASPGMLCNLEFDPLFGTEDAAAMDLQIKAVASTAVVQFIEPSSHSRVRIDYVLIKDGQRWKIHDIVYMTKNRLSLRSVLGRKSSQDGLIQPH
jgi:hypothetical protein